MAKLFNQICVCLNEHLLYQEYDRSMDKNIGLLHMEVISEVCKKYGRRRRRKVIRIKKIKGIISTFLVIKRFNAVNVGKRK